MQTQMQDRLTGIADYWVPVNDGRAHSRHRCQMYIWYLNDEIQAEEKKTQPYKEISYQLPLASS